MKGFRKLISLLLTAVMLLSLMPTAAFAIEPGLAEDRTINKIEKSGIQFKERYNNGRTGTFYMTRDAASKRMMFCIDPGFNYSGSNFSQYNVSVANGGNVETLLNVARSQAMIGNVSTDIMSGEAAADLELDNILGPEALDALDTTTLQTLIELMSVLHIHYDKTGKYDKYEVYAVQNYIWHTCNPNSLGMWYKVVESELPAVKAAYYSLMQEVYTLYHSGVSSFSMTCGDASLRAFSSLQSAMERPLTLHANGQDTVTKSVTVTAGLNNFKENVKYIGIDGVIQSFSQGETATSADGNFTITRTENGFDMSINIGADAESSPNYQLVFLKNNSMPTAENVQYGGEDWAIFAKGPLYYQSFFSAYKSPNADSAYLVVNADKQPDQGIPVFPYFQFDMHKMDQLGWFDRDQCTPAGGSDLSATFTVTWETDMGDSGSESVDTDMYGHGASVTIYPWDDLRSSPEDLVTYAEETSTYAEEGEDGESEEIEFVSKKTYTGSCEVTVTETNSPLGHFNSETSYTHEIEYYAETSRDDPQSDFPPYTYTITIDGESYTMSEDEVLATEDDPITSPDGEDVFYNKVYTGALQIIKEIGSDDIFSQEDGKGTVAGGAQPGKEYSTNSFWTIRVINENIMADMTPENAEKFLGYEDCPYLKVTRDTNHAMNQLMNVYKVMDDGSGTPADMDNPLTVSKFGQMYLYNIPYGCYLVSEISADADRYVLESFYVYIPHDGYVHSTDVINGDKENIIEIVKVDEETGKTIPSAKTAFRIRYLGSPEYDDPTQTPGYGRYLPNASNINASVTSPDDYIFYTDVTGKAHIPYALPYGSYQLEEIVVPDGYFVGAYGQDGEAGSVEGSQTYNKKVAVYDKDGNHIDYTKDEEIVYNYYPFQVTEQNDHLDGEDYEPFYLTVTMANSQVKGKVEISKLGERLVGFQEVEKDGYTVFEPVFESFPLPGTTFDIYAAEDILLQDGEEPPVAYDKLTDEEIQLVTDVLTHAQFPDMEIVKSGTHEASGAEIIHTIDREISENNLSLVEYLTPLQKGTTYQLDFSRKAEGFTYDYEITFGFEYSAGGWNYTDIHVKRTITADDYLPYIDDTMPVLKNGEAEVPYDSSTVFSNQNKIEVNSEIINEYDMSTILVEPQVFSTTTVLVPDILDNTNPDFISNMPEIPDGYSLYSVSNTRFLIQNDQYVTDIQAARVNNIFNGWVSINNLTKDLYLVPDGANEPEVPEGYTLETKADYYLITNEKDKNDVKVASATTEWLNKDEADPGSYLIPAYTADAVANLPELPNDVTFLYATMDSIYVNANGTVKVIQIDEDEKLYFLDSGDSVSTTPKNVPEGYTYEEMTGIITCYKDDEETGERLYKCYVYDPERKDYRWVESDYEGNIYKTRIQEINLSLTQHNKSTDGWTFEMDGIVLHNIAVDEDVATATIFNPYEAEPVISDSIGCSITTDTVEGGKQTAITIKHPIPPVYFKMIDGTTVEMVFLGGFSKTILNVQASAELPKIYYKNQEIDYFNNADGGLTPDNNYNELVYDEYNYVRTTRHEATEGVRETYYTIEIVSSATQEADAFKVDYYGAYESMTLVVPDAVTGAQRGNLQFSTIYKTMRYPLSGLVERITTGENGIATSSLLPLGDYVIREVSCPDGFVASNLAYPFSLTYENQFTPLIWTSAEVNNGAMSVQLDLYKEFQLALGSDVYEPKAGAVFGVYSYTPIGAANTATGPVTTTTIPADTLVATVTTDEFGKAIETLKLPIGDYYVKELATLPGYELNDTRFIFRVDEETRADSLNFKYPLAGVSGKVSHTGYKMAEIEIATLTQIPALSLTVNGITYDTSKALDEKTVGNGVLVQNTVDADRSTFLITASVEKPVDITFANGSSLTVNVQENTYDALFTTGEEAAELNTGTGKNISTVTNADGTVSVKYNPYVAYTGYVAETNSMLRDITTQAAANDGTTAMFLIDRASGSRKVLITYDTSKYSYYHKLPTQKVMQPSEPPIEVDVPYIPENAILFGTDTDYMDVILNEANVIPEGWLINPEEGTIIVDLSVAAIKDVRFGIDATGEAVICTGTTWHADSGTDMTLQNAGGVKNIHKESHAVLDDGTQPDWITTTTAEGSARHVWTIKTLELSAVGGASSASVTMAPDHTYATAAITKGTATNIWVNGEAKELTDHLTILPSYEAVVLMSDGTTYRFDLNNNGFMKMSAEGIVSGSIGDSNKPILKVNGSESNFLDVQYKVITQAMPMDETSYNDIRQYNTQSVTLARSDDWVKQLQVKINASSDINSGIPDGGADGEGSGTNPIPNDVRPYILKTDVTGAKLLAGAKIEIYDMDGKTIASGYSDEEGKFYFDKPASGEYTFKEVYAPNGYKLNEEIFNFTVHPDGTITGDNTIKDEKIPDTPGPGPSTPKVTLNKVDAVTTEGIPGARIEVWNEERTKIYASGISDRDGKFTFDRPGSGIWWFREVEAPEGYVLNDAWYSFTVESNGHVTGDNTITNDRKKVIISKVDVTNSNGIPGSKIEVLDSDNNVIASGFSDGNGYFGFYRPDPGIYYFHEVVAPEGYILNEEFFSFTVNEDGTITGDLTITNVPNTIVIEKVEPWTSKPIEGATIELWDEEGKLIQVGITDSDGLVYFAAPKLGTYIYREALAPEGYILDEGTHVITIHGDGTITGERRFTNTPYIPRTGLMDWSNILLAGAGLMGIALIGLLVVNGRRKKKKNQ